MLCMFLYEDRHEIRGFAPVVAPPTLRGEKQGRLLSFTLGACKGRLAGSTDFNLPDLERNNHDRKPSVVICSQG